MKSLFLCAASLVLTAPAVHSATLVADWTDFMVQSSNGFLLNLSGSSYANPMGYLDISNSTATNTAYISGGELAARSNAGGNNGRLEMIVTMTFDEISAPTSGAMPLFSTRLSGNNNTYWGVSLTSEGKLQGLWSQTPWTTLTSSVIDLTTPFTLTAAFSDAGTVLYIDGVKIASAGGLKSAAGNTDTGNDFLYIGGVETSSPSALLSAADFTISDLYIHKGVMTDAEVSAFYTNTVIPEPSTYAAASIAGALVLTMALRRRKNRATA
ncbi:MAG: LamG domain-containing protein [Puniceicoccales bacterium]|jgi:hypothetical protein|nr:LamG domain-containing protein [Puniceicoccales bacterium]